jgi:hypothetical protein
MDIIWFFSIVYFGKKNDMTGEIIVNNYQVYENWINVDMLDTRYNWIAVIVGGFLFFYFFIL